MTSTLTFQRPEHRFEVNPWSRYSIGPELSSHGALMGTLGNAAVPVADVVYYFPWTPAYAATVVKVYWANGIAAANGVEVGLYSSAGALLVSGSANATTNTVLQRVDVTDYSAAARNRYYIAFVCHSTSPTFRRLATTAELLEASGVLQQTGQASLPATATFAPMATSYVPLFGLMLNQTTW